MSTNSCYEIKAVFRFKAFSSRSCSSYFPTVSKFIVLAQIRTYTEEDYYNLPEDIRAEHNFSRQEIKEGLEDIASRYGWSGLASAFLTDS